MKIFRDCAIFVFVIYFMIAYISFTFRHPWMTDTERVKNIGKALMFEKVSYEETRNKYK